jgi:YidC/Oxa1 family membrane protein insertase
MSPWDFFVSIFVNSLMWIYNLLVSTPGAFGISIILFTILIRLITWPLNAAQLKSAKAMQDLQNDKEWQNIQKKYEKDRETLAQEQMRIYREKGINPFASCLPMFIQLPVIIALYQSITRSLAITPLALLQLTRSIGGFLDVSIIPLSSKFLWFDLSRPEFIAIPGINFNLPVLAVIVALTTYVQTRLTTPPSTNPNDQSAAMTGVMSIYMPFLLGWFALTFPSGLAIYFITTNTLGIVQYAMMGKANWRNLLPGGSTPQPAKKK